MRALFEGVRRGVLIAESIWPNDAYRGRQRHQHADRRGCDRAVGGAAFHDNKVWIKPVALEPEFGADGSAVRR